MARRRRGTRERCKAFLEQAQSDVGGFYRLLTNSRPVEFVRPLEGAWVRVKDMRNGAKFNVHFEDLEPLPEMEVLALMTWTEEDERRSIGPETVETKTEDEPQEPGDVEFFH